jgi:hypothetical protein
VVDRAADGAEVLLGDPAYEEDLDIVLNCHELRIIDARFAGQLLARGIDFHGDWAEAKLRLVLDHVWVSSVLEDDAVLAGLGPRFGATLAAVRQDGPARLLSICFTHTHTHTLFVRALRGFLHAGTVALVIGDHDKSAEADVEPLAKVLSHLKLGDRPVRSTFNATGALWFGPEHFEDLNGKRTLP